MDKNFYCNGVWFSHYAQAKMYAEHVLKTENKYHVVYTKAEKDSIINAIDHELECGK